MFWFAIIDHSIRVPIQKDIVRDSEFGSIQKPTLTTIRNILSANLISKIIKFPKLAINKNEAKI